jgi:hypothetical protein
MKHYQRNFLIFVMLIEPFNIILKKKILLDQLPRLTNTVIYRYPRRKVLLHIINFSFGPQFENVRIS